MKKVGLLASLMALLGNSAFAFSELVPTPPTSFQGLDDKVNTVLGMIQWIGFVVGTAMIIYIGIKYLTAGAGQKAEVKSTMVPLLCGALLVMLAPTIAVWVFSI